MPLRLLDNEKDNAGAVDTDNATADDNDEKGLDALKAGAASPDLENENEASNIEGKKEKPQYDSSLPLALQRTFFYPFWLSGILYATGGTSPPPITHHLHLRMESDHNMRAQMR